MARRLQGLLAVFIALVMLAPASAFAQGTTGTVRGKVTDLATGQPLAAVNVVVTRRVTTSSSTYPRADITFGPR
jgi:hypothetical protein